MGVALCMLLGAMTMMAPVDASMDTSPAPLEQGITELETDGLPAMTPAPEITPSPIASATESDGALGTAGDTELVAAATGDEPYVTPVPTGVVWETNNIGYAYKSSYTDDTVLEFTDPQYITDEKFFSEYLNYEDYTGLAAVQSAAEAGNYELAKEEFLKYYQTREKQFPASAGGNAKRDRLMSALLEHNYTYNTNSGLTCVELPTVESHEYQLVELDITEELKSVADSTSRDMPFYITARNKDGAQVSILSKEYGDKTQGARIMVEANGVQTPFNVTDDAMVTAGEGTNDSTNYKDRTELLAEESLSSVNYNTPLEEGNGKPKHFPADENTKRVFFKFNLEGVAETSSITRATLQFYAKINDVENTVNRKDLVVFVTKNADWNEDTVCYNSVSNYIFSYEHEPALRWHRPHFGAAGHRYTDELFRWNWDRTTSLYRYNFANENVRESYAYTSLRQLASYLTWFGGTPVAPLTHWGTSGTVQIDSYLGVALRNNMLSSLLMTYADSKHMSPELFTAAVKYMWSLGDYAYTKKPQSNNIGAQEISGGYKVAVYFKELMDSQKWIDKQIGNSIDYMKNYMQADGSSIEVGLGYITYALDGITGITKTADARNEKLEFDEETLQILSDFANYLVYISGPGGREIQQGQGNTITDTTIRNTLETICNLTGNPYAQYVVTNGKKGQEPLQTSAIYEVGQKYTMRSDWNKTAVFLQTNADGGFQSHGDPDDLSIILWAYDQYLLADPLYSSYQGGEAATWLGGTIGHNTVVVNDTSQAKPATEAGKGKTNYWESNNVYDFLDVSTKNYANQNVEHARKILYIKPGYFLVSDYLEPTDGKEKNYKQGWHFQPTANLTISEDGNTLQTHMNGANIQVSTAVGNGVTGVLDENGYYGMGHNAVVGNVKWGYFEQESDQNAVFNTLLYPEELGKNGLVKTSTEQLALDGVQNNGVVALKVNINDTKAGVLTEGNYYLVHDRSQIANRAFGKFSTDGAMSYVEQQNGKTHVITFQEGTELRSELGMPYLLATEKVSDLGVSYESGTMKLASSDEKLNLETLTVFAPQSINKVTFNGESVPFKRTGDYIYFGDEAGVSDGAKGPEDSGSGNGNGSGNGGGSIGPERPSHGNGGGSGTGGGNGVTKPVDPINPVKPEQKVSRYFNDVGSTYEWAANYIDTLYEKGIVNGVDVDTFVPGASVTRAEYIKMLMGALGIAPKAEVELPFADVSKDNWAYGYIAAAYETGIVKGISETEFGADAPISRQDIAVMTERALTVVGKTLEKKTEAAEFADNAGIADYAAGSVRAMQEAGILSGTPEGYFYPGANATRAESAKIIYSVIE